jgi:hypothetical protein
MVIAQGEGAIAAPAAPAMIGAGTAAWSMAAMMSLTSHMACLGGINQFLKR